MAKPKAEFRWNYSSSIIIANKGFGTALNYKSAEILNRHCFKFMPYRSGYMANAVRINANKDRGMITYTSRYAKIQHDDENLRHDNPLQKHPLATDHWEKACMLSDGNQIVREINDYRKRIAK